MATLFGFAYGYSIVTFKLPFLYTLAVGFFTADIFPKINAYFGLYADWQYAEILCVLVGMWTAMYLFGGGGRWRKLRKKTSAALQKLLQKVKDLAPAPSPNPQPV